MTMLDNIQASDILSSLGLLGAIITGGIIIGMVVAWVKVNYFSDDEDD